MQTKRQVEDLREVGTVDIRWGKRLVCRTYRFAGRDFLDLRIFVQTGEDRWSPTGKGFAIPAEPAGEVATLCKRCQVLLEAPGEVGRKRSWAESKAKKAS